MISIDIQNFPDSKWNERLLTSKLGTVYQTKNFADAQSLIGGTPNYISFLNETGKIVAQLLIISYSKFQNKGSIGKILGKFSGSKGQTYIWVYGPVVFDFDYSLEIIQSLKNFLISKKWKFQGSNHPLSNEFLSEIGEPFKIQDRSTFLINLLNDKEDIWNKMDKHSVRKNISRSESRGVTIKKMVKSDFLLYLKLFEETGKVTPFTSDEIAENWWEQMKPVGHNGFLAYQDTSLVGAMAITTFNDYVNEFGIVRSSQDYTEKLYSQDLLKWKIIDWSIFENFRYYDLTGVFPNSSDQKEIGIYRYKKKWGGELTKCSLITS
ncbi:hypothetical protein C5F49_00740 [Nitrosopumilus oxyclinae]|uniref:BioF2-like acetyltransferase domain-containing protein n=1 Tax=Nitrosopumilus oxyclinae TaxID=1959104 RepID=A0A7D5M204_9ARCH|nr:peptidoglycan bridge formation glycyltransferase FemA/FemB family protein [Nitrosopumilus oxyclinae]QLH04011.1 hypothetical protein C5F49_00740 [Nitrosopumilus oxyclinae]